MVLKLNLNFLRLLFMILVFVINFDFGCASVSNPLLLRQRRVRALNSKSIGNEKNELLVDVDVDVDVPLFDMFKSTPEIFAHLTPFILNHESTTPQLLSLVQKIPRLYHILFRLASSSLKEDFPLNIMDCFGFFSLKEIIFLHQLAPEICLAHRNKRLGSFLESKRSLLSNLYDNYLISLVDTRKYFLQVLANLEERSCSWEERTRFVKLYHKSALIPANNRESLTISVITTRVLDYFDKFTRSLLRYQLDSEFVKRVINTNDFACHDKTRYFVTGNMLALEYDQYSIRCWLRTIRCTDPKVFFEGFISSNPESVCDNSKKMKKIKVRNIELTNSFPFLKRDIFILGNLLKFGSASDIDSIDPLHYLNLFLFSNWDSPKRYSNYILVTIWRRPRLSDAWHRLYERFPVKNDFVTACFAPELFIRSTPNLVLNKTAQDIMLKRSALPPVPISELFFDNFRKSLMSYILEHPGGGELGLPFSIYYGMRSDCFIRSDKMFYSQIMTVFELKFPDRVYNNQFLLQTIPSLDSMYGALFICSIFNNDQKALAIVRDSFSHARNDEAKFKFFSECLKLRLIPVAYMQRFLMTWTGATESDIQIVLSRDSLLENDNGTFENSAQERLAKVLKSLYVKTQKYVFYHIFPFKTISMDEIKYADLWHFYLKFNETAFRRVCASFASYVRSFDNDSDLKVY